MLIPAAIAKKISINRLKNIRLQLVFEKLGFAVFLTWRLLVYFIRDTVAGRIFFGLLLPVALIGALTAYLLRPLPPDYIPAETVMLKVPAGANFNQIADSLHRKGVLSNKMLFRLMGRLSGKDKKIHAGLIEVPKGLSTWQLLSYLEAPPTKKFRVTLPEGILSDQMAGLLQQYAGVDSARFVQLVRDSTFASQLVPGVSSLEGFLLPETYFLEWQMPTEDLIELMVKNTLAIFEPDSVQRRLAELNWSPLQALTLASIIEGEAMIDSERVIISSLYHNRLRLGWHLQADPTLQYAIPGPPRRLLHKDLNFDSPYNTYKYPGLPPGPINNPGKLSILAALFPANTPYMFMVATGDGGHKFSKTLREHNYWHDRFNEVRRRVRQEKRRQQSAKE